MDLEEKITNIIIQKLEEQILQKFGDSFISKIINNVTARIEESIASKLESHLAKTTTIEAEVQALRQELNNDIKEIAPLMKSFERLNAEIEETRSETEKLEQYSRRTSIRIYGLQNKTNEPVEQTVIKMFQDNLKLELSCDDIEACHRVGVVNKDGVRAVIVKFKSIKTKNAVFYRKKLLKNSKITIREDLTKVRSKLMKAAIEAFGNKNIWTKNGTIIILKNETKHYVNNIKDLTSLMSL